MSPVSGKDYLARFAGSIDRLHIRIDTGGPEAQEYLQFRGGGEAVTVADPAGATIYFASENPGASSVLEELAHVLQHHRRRFVDEDILLMAELREIEAKECLEANGDRFALPPEERLETAAQLEASRARLRLLRAQRL